MSSGKIFQPAYASTSDQRVVQTRAALRRALLELLDEKALENISIREIAATAGIGYTTFFRHHTGKDDLLDDIAAAEMRRLFDLTLPVLDPANTRASVLALARYVDEHRPLWRRLLTGGAASRLREEFLRLTLEFAEAYGSQHAWLPPEVGVRFGVSSSLELLAWWLQQGEPVSVEEFAVIHERLVVQPLMRRDP